ncbi:Transposable element Tcb2 transposase [Anthophora retusa]
MLAQYCSKTLALFEKRASVEKRLAWARENVSRDWDNIVFTDECSFWGWLPVKKAWSIQKVPYVQRAVKHAIKVHVWGCFNVRGFGTLCLFTDNLNAIKMKEIYQRGLLTSTNKWFNKYGEDWILQEGNDPKHRSRLCTEWKTANGIVTLDWPSQSPDANPIENVWALMKQKLQGKRLHSVKSLSNQIRQIWRSLPVSYAERLVESMPKRCEAIIANAGDWTHY